MNKLTKVGLSALCGSLAAFSSANAGDMTVTGGVDMSWVSLGGGTGHTGNPLGIGSNLTFKGSGELDNGWTFDYTVAMLNADAYSSAALNLDMGGLGKLNVNQGDSGNGIDAFDDKMPTAWEEPWGAGLGTGVALVSGAGPENNLQYTFPTVGGVTLVTAVVFDDGSADVSDKGTGVASNNTGRTYDATINVNPSMGTEILSGLNMFIGGSMTENYDTNGNNDRYEAVGGLTLDIGPISLGYATSGISTGEVVTGSNVDWYKNHMYGIAFNINDDLSVSYGKHESQQGFVNPGTYESVDMDITSAQIAYSIGGASVRVAEIDVDNGSYQTGTAYDKEARVVSLSLAF
jgi:outer membrane protein OmpU